MAVIPVWTAAQTRLDDDGTLVVNGRRRFILGCYYNPEDATVLQDMARNGLNLVYCKPDRSALDQAQRAGLYGWINTGGDLDLSENNAVKSKNLTSLITGLKDHPALAVWEAPDEAAWNLFYPNLEKKIRQENMTESTLDSLQQQHDQAAKRLCAGFRQGVALLRDLDPARPIWFNHAPRNSRQQLAPFSALADIIGCDIYPIRVGHTEHSDLTDRTLSCVGAYTDLMQATAPAKPVWMVLQAFSWDKLVNRQPPYDPQGFPTYAESRFMAYDAIVHGATGLLWWGSFNSSPQAAFWRAILSVTREIADLEPFLTAPELKQLLTVAPAPMAASQPTRVGCTFRQWQNDYLLVVLQEDNEQYVKVSGLQCLNGRTLYEIGSRNSYVVQQGRLLISYHKKPHVLITDLKYVTQLAPHFPDDWDSEKHHPLQETVH